MENIIWPNSINPQDYPIHSYNSLQTPNQPKELWQKLIKAQEWPGWYPNSQKVLLVSQQGSSNTLMLGTKFIWYTFGVKVYSEVIDFEPMQSIGWTAKEILGWRGYHGFRFIPNSQGTLIVTEEVQKGPGDFLIKNFIQKNLEQQHQIWLEKLVEK